jgi:hypothetical protein
MVARAPNFEHVQRTMQRERQNNDLLKIPCHRDITRIPTLITTTIRNETFLKFDSEHGEYRTLIFPSSSQLEILAEANIISIDGTL